ncbi:phosphatidylglycerophosphatase A family protein [Bdellovibrio bacteriovorus]|nr:phosphatidylglycerophosphatase A [Bdellovibrio bacteriovorus]
MREFLKQLATLFGVGRIKKAPGTWGTLATIPLVIGLNHLGPFYYMSAVALLLVVGTLACHIYEQDHEGHDHKEIVIDEVLGFLITMVWLPMTWQAILIGFVLFRVLDIGKPLFIGYLDKKVQGGLGVMLDDVAAGLVASLIMQVLYTQTNWLGSQITVIHSGSVGVKSLSLFFAGLV